MPPSYIVFAALARRWIQYSIGGRGETSRSIWCVNGSRRAKRPAHEKLHKRGAEPQCQSGNLRS